MTRILAVDDNPTNLRLVLDVLRSRGFAPLSAASGQEALAVLAENEVDVLLIDVQMPGMSGTDLARQLRGDPQFAALKLVAVTAMAMRGDREGIMEAGFDDYLAKPYRLSDLFAVVERNS